MKKVPAWTRTGVYAITCPSGEQYIGSTTNFCFRWSRHRQLLRRGAHNSKILQAAFDAHGEEAIKFETLVFCAREHLLMYEQIMMDALQPSCNQLKFAGSARGMQWSAESRAKSSATHILKNIVKRGGEKKQKPPKEKRVRRLSEEHKAKLFASRRGCIVSEETRRKLSESKRGTKMSEAHKERLRAMHLGRPLAEETKRKLSENSPAVRAVRCIETGQVFRSATEAANSLPAKNKRAAAAGICNACKGRLKKTSGYSWEYVDEPCFEIAKRERAAEYNVTIC